MKKTKPMIMITFFLAIVVLPFVSVDAVISGNTYITNPYNDESFAYSDTSQTFSGYYQGTGYVADVTHTFQYQWKIDSVVKDTGSGSVVSSHGGVVQVNDDLDYLMNPSSYSVSSHQVVLTVNIYYLGAYQDQEYDINYFTRAVATSVPEITWNSPALDMQQYNYSALGTSYLVSVDLDIEAGSIDNLWMWVNDVEIEHWGEFLVTPTTRSRYITIDSEIVYEITFLAQSIYNYNRTTTRFVIGFVEGSSIIATLYSYLYTNRPTFDPFIITNSYGLDNLTIFLDFDDIITVDQTDSFAAVTCNLTYDKLIEISDYYQATGLSMIYDKVQIWDEDYLIDDSGERFFEFTDESEHVVDSGDYYNTVNSYEEDDMSQQLMDDWAYRLPLTVGYTAVATNVAVNYTITNSDPVYARDKANGDDWVIKDSSDNTLYHWLETYDDTGNSILWFNCNLINGDSVFYLYYGNVGASNSESPSNVFLAWDDFDDGYSPGGAPLGARGWTVTSGTPTIENAPFGDSNKALRIKSGVAYDELNNFWTDNLEVVIHATYYVETQDTEIGYFHIYEDATLAVTGKSLGTTDEIYYHNGADYASFVPSLDWTEDTAHSMKMYIRDDDFDVNFDGTDHEGGLRGAYTDGIDKIVILGWFVASSSIHWWDDFFVYDFLGGTLTKTTGSEEPIYDDWDIGEHIDWYVGGSTVGERNSTTMTVWNPVSSAQGYCYVQDENLQLDEPIQNSAYSWEVNISCNDVTHITDIGISILADSGYYYKMLLTSTGYCVAGVGTNPYSTTGMLTGYTNTDISWTGDWVTLNITILPDIRVIYFVDDVIIRDSYLDDAWQDRTDANCGLFYLLMKNAAGEVNGNMTIDYFNTTDYGDGHAGSGGQAYYEYSNPGIVVYNGSRWLGTAEVGGGDAVGIFSNFGGGTWLNYRDSDSVSFKSRFRLNTADLMSYDYYNGFKVCAKANTTDDWFYGLDFTNTQQGRIYFRLSNHSGSYGAWLTAGYLEGINCSDGLWHTYEIQIVKDCWVAGFYDDVLVANTTNTIWLEVWDVDDEENMIVSHFTYHPSGYNSSTIEIDYWSETNYTYNYWTSSEGWDWLIGSVSVGDRVDNAMVFNDAVADDYCYMWVNNPTTQFYGCSEQQYFIECQLMINETVTDYEGIEVVLRISATEYYSVCFYGNDTIGFGTGDYWSQAHPSWDWITSNLVDFDLVTGEWNTVRIVVDKTNDWVALWVTGELLENSTYTVGYTLNDYLIFVDNAAGNASKSLFVKNVKSGWDEWVVSDATTAGLTYDTTPSLPADVSEDYSVNWTSTQACRIWGSVVTDLNVTGWEYVIFVDSSCIFYDSRLGNDTWILNATQWAYIGENTEFTLSIRVGDDGAAEIPGIYTWLNYTLIRDSVAPTVTLNSPENRPESDPYSNLQIIPLDYDLWDLNVDNQSWTNDMKILMIDDESFTGDEWWMYPKHKPLQFWEDWHTLTVMATDLAGNDGNASATFYYEERLAKPLELTFTSSIDDQTINPEQYLNIYIDGMPISAITVTDLNDFNITVYDKFGILLNHTADIEYAATINIQVPLRPVVFENNNDIVCKYKIVYGLFEKSFWIQSDTNQTYYLNDTNYILVAEPGDTYFNETHWYGQTYVSFTVESGMSEIDVILDLVSDDPLHQPLRITVYDKDFDISGYIYVYYETSWGNTTVLVEDNDVPLGSSKSEGWSIWIFDTEDYSLHNITIFIKNGEDVVFSDGFSFTLEEPEANPNYYLTIHTSIDVSGGILYVTINTDWGNCTIRVFDNGVPLGGNTSEGSSTWEFDETEYGLHNFTVEVYQGYDLWDTIITSVTIMAPDAETLSLTLYSVQFDSSSSRIYVNYQTTWGNTTCQVFDNGTDLGSAVSGEELSIWTTTTAYGWHNITVKIYDNEVLWFTDVFSFTIVEPSTETNYYEALVISIDANAGQLYTSIHTYFGNCTIRAFDNSTPLGDNTTEGNIIWTFDSSSYGFHNFSIVVYQGNDIWHTIYTSITIVEPTPEESMLFTLFEKSVDVDSGLFYLNYETNWQNTTCRVRDNSTWLGNNASEGLSIWTFSTDYGWHNITIEFYCGNDLVYVDVISFVIQEPDSEINYYLTIDTSTDVSSGLFYLIINTYWDNCTVRVKDNSTWLGSAVDEGSSTWEFDSSAYGLHVFTIEVYQNGDLWDTITTSITIVEPAAEINYYLIIDTSVDASSGLIYVTINTYFGNCTIRVADNSSWLGGNASEGSTIWSFDETAYGFHNFSIFVYQGNNVWNMVYTSLTIVEPSAEELAITLYEKSYDAESGYIYINYNTNWENTTVRVMDNGTWIGSAVSGEGLSIWTTTTDYGWHNITIVIYHDGVLFFKDEFSFTLVEPSAESNYYQVFSISVDADSGLLYTDILTYWGNCTIRVADNSTWLGGNMSEGNNIWSFDESVYGIHNFSIVVYQGLNIWHTFYSSVTIVEPDLEVLALTTYEKHFDADAGLLYVNYQTNWQNTTIRIMDNSTWLGSAVSGEENSIWMFAASIGLHNITVVIYDDGVEWFTDIFSFTINIPYQVWKDVSFTFRSDYDSGYIDADYYLKIFLDGVLIGASALTYKDNFSLTIYDEFDQLLYENASYQYQYSSTIYLPLRGHTINNNDFIPVSVVILASGSDAGSGLYFLVPSRGGVSVYLKDGSYTMLDIPTVDEVAGGSKEIYTAISVVVDASATVTSTTLLLGTKSDPVFLLNFSWTKLSEANQRILEAFTWAFIVLVILSAIIIFLVVRNRRERKRKEELADNNVKLVYIHDREKSREENERRQREVEEENKRRREARERKSPVDTEMDVDSKKIKRR